MNISKLINKLFTNTIKSFFYILKILLLYWNMIYTKTLFIVFYIVIACYIIYKDDVFYLIILNKN